MTDEEVVKALETCKNGEMLCQECPCFIKDAPCICSSEEDIDTVLNLICRLQEENGEQKAEIERLTKETNEDTITHIDLCTENFSLRKQNAELQKQVDELKSVLADTIKRNEELIEENGQSVKGTAKEICVLLSGFGIDAMLEAIRETYGVEVE